MCTLYSLKKNDKVFTTLNFDWFGKPDGTVLFTQARKDRYAYMVTSQHGKYFPYEGMNDRGLYIGQTAVPAIKRNVSLTKPVFTTCILLPILRTCSTVEEAVAIIKSRSVIFGTTLGLSMFHCLIADETGNSAIVEFMDDTIIITAEEDYQLMTNFYVSNPEILWKNHVEGCGGYARYTIAEKLLKSAGDVSFDICMNIARAANTTDFTYDGNTLNTIWTGIYNLKDREMRLYYRMDYATYKTYNLMDEMRKGTRKIVMSDAFKQ